MGGAQALSQLCSGCRRKVDAPHRALQSCTWHNLFEGLHVEHCLTEFAVLCLMTIDSL